MNAAKPALSSVGPSKDPTDTFLRHLIETYSHPEFGRTKYNFDAHDELMALASERELDSRFHNDRAIFLRALLQAADKNATVDSALAPAIVQAIRSLCAPGASPSQSLPERIDASLAAAGAPQHSVTSKDTSRAFQPASGRAALLATFLDQLIEDQRVPRFNDYDHVDDIVAIVRSRYAGPVEKHRDRSDAVLHALGALAAGAAPVAPASLPAALRAVLGDDHPYVPRRSKTAPPQITSTIGDLFEELNHLKAEDDPNRFLQINREYSLRQRNQRQRTSNSNPWGLSILGGFEENHHMMLRALCALRRDGKITEKDEALVVGSRYADELDFFRQHLHLPKTIGLDLCDDPEGGIIAGDMHQMPFAAGRFRFLYCAGTLCYSYDMRRAISEFARVLTRPGYMILTDAADRVNGADPLGRSDAVSVEGLVGFFHEHAYRIIGRDRGRSCAPATHRIWPSLVIELL